VLLPSTEEFQKITQTIFSYFFHFILTKRHLKPKDSCGIFTLNQECLNTLVFFFYSKLPTEKSVRKQRFH